MFHYLWPLNQKLNTDFAGSPCCCFTKELNFRDNCCMFLEGQLQHNSGSYATTLEVALLLLPPPKFVHPPCRYYLWQKFKEFKAGITSSDMMFTPCFTRTRPLVHMLSWRGGGRKAHGYVGNKTHLSLSYEERRLETCNSHKTVTSKKCLRTFSYAV